jgi:hypothetical protein
MHLRQADPAVQPFLYPRVFGEQPGIQFKGVHQLLLNDLDRANSSGVLQIYVIGKTVHNDLVSDINHINPPSTLIGTTTSEAYNQFGMRGGQLRYHDGSNGWITTLRGAALNDGRCRLIWARHQNKSIVLGTGTTAYAADTRAGFHTDYTGWNALGAGYGGIDRSVFSFAAVVIIPGPALSTTELKKLNLWARKWGCVSL